MNQINLFHDVVYDDESVVIDEIMETSCIKELRIAMQMNQSMYDRQSDHPLLIEVLQGVVVLSWYEHTEILQKGDLIAIEKDVVHHLVAKEDTLLRVSLLLCQDSF